MATQKIIVLKNNFSAGELSETCWYRPELKKYTDGLALCENFLPSIMGGIDARQGTYFKAEAKYSGDREVIFSSFVYSSTDNYVLEIGYKYIRFFRNKEPVLIHGDASSIILNSENVVITSEDHNFNIGTLVFIRDVVGTTELNGNYYLVGNPTIDTITLCDRKYGAKKISLISQDNPCQVTCVGHNLVANDYVCIDDLVGMDELNGLVWQVDSVIDDDNFIIDVDSTLFVEYEKYGEIRKSIDGSTMTTYISGGYIIAPYEVVTTYDEIDISDGKLKDSYINQANELVFTNGLQNQKLLKRIDFDEFTFEDVVYGSSISAPSSVTLTTSGGTDMGFQYFVTSVNENFEESLPKSTSVVNGPASILNGQKNGKKNSLVISRVEGAIGYNIYRTNSECNYKDINFVADIEQSVSGDITYYDSGERPASFGRSIPREQVLFSESIGYPTNSIMYSERMVLSRGRDLYLSRVKSPFNFNVSKPIGDTDSFSNSLSGKDSDEILWLLDLNKYLLVGTYSNVYRVAPSDNFTVKPNGIFANIDTVGSTNINPIKFGERILFLQEYGRNINELVYNFDVNGFKKECISYLFEHLIKDGILWWSFKDDSDPIIYIILPDGNLLSLIYARDEAVVGASKLIFENGFVYDIVNVPGNFGSDTYLIVERIIDGKKVRYIEVFNERFTEDTNNLFDFCGVDCAIHAYTGNDNNIIIGLDYLVGETVQVIGRLGFIGEFVIDVDGTITLDEELDGGECLVGYKIENKLKTLPVDLISQNASLQSMRSKIKQIKYSDICYKNSLGFQVGSCEYDLENVIDFVDENDEFDEPLNLKSGKITVTDAGQINEDGSVFIFKNKPHPLHLVYISSEVEIA